MQTVLSHPPPVAPQPRQRILVSLWSSWQRAISSEEERGEGVVRGREVCAQRACKWDSERAASFAGEEQKPICCTGCMCLRGRHVFRFSGSFARTRGADRSSGWPANRWAVFVLPAIICLSIRARFLAVCSGPYVSNFLQVPVILL